MTRANAPGVIFATKAAGPMGFATRFQPGAMLAWRMLASMTYAKRLATANI